MVSVQDIQGYLDRNHATEARQGKKRRTLYGCFKFIAPMPTFASVGDYLILAQCLEWMKKNNQKYTRQEVARSLKYFEDYDPRDIKVRRQLVDSLIALGQDI